MKRGTALVPTFLAFAVTKLLEQHYEKLVDYGFTASMEDDLDRIAAGEEQRVDWLTRFYRGENGEPGLHTMVTEHLDEIDARVGELDRAAAQRHRRARRPLRAVPRARRARASLPDDIAPDELTPEKAEELLARPSERALARRRPRRPAGRSSSGTGATGPTSPRTPPEDADEKPRTASLFQSMSPETVTLEDALRLLCASTRRR